MRTNPGSEGKSDWGWSTRYACATVASGQRGETDEMDPLLTSKEAAALLSVSQATLSRWRTQQSGPPNVNLQGIPRYRRDDLEKWVEGNLA